MDNKIIYLTLHHMLGKSPVKLHQLLKQLESPSALLDAFKQNALLKKLTAKQQARIRKNYQTDIDRDLAWASQNPSHHILTIEDPRYPALLKEINDPPLILYVHGEPRCLKNTQIAIVGSRNPTPFGQAIAAKFTQKLGENGLTLTSGLALGIDGSVHQAALTSNTPTIAVLGCGVNIIYPKSHHLIAKKIPEQGAVISEHPISTPPIAENFPKRNRIISGLSIGTLVVEATLRSGSLITAHLAANQNREVFAIPGALGNPLSRGCHALIKKGAKLVENIEDILSELQIDQISTSKCTPIDSQLKTLDQTDRKLLECVGFETTSAQEVSSMMNLPLQNVRSLLLNLELRGYIKTIPGGHCRVKI